MGPDRDYRDLDNPDSDPDSDSDPDPDPDSDSDSVVRSRVAGGARSVAGRSSALLLSCVAALSAVASFVVPYARDARGALVAPDEAERTRAYRCPECDGAVDLHAGARKRRHFHHRTGTACSSESVAHRTATELVADAVRRWRAGEGPAPRFVRGRAADGCDHSAEQAAPSKVIDAACEHRLPSGRVVDVVLLARGGIPVAAVEVCRTHEVDADKRLALPLPWIEVDAVQVCESRGLRLVPLQERFLPWLCPAHAPSRRERARAVRDEPRRRAALLRRLPFRLHDFPGFDATLAPCPAGHDALLFTWRGREPPFPRPPLLVARAADADRAYSRAQGGWRELLPWRRSYASVCPVCGAAVPAPASC